ncbi:MAG: 23S rRNA pseudouridine(955/2504/2580) synthase RluC [Enterovibrio sp.]
MNKEQDQGKSAVQLVEIAEDIAGQRIDNYLLNFLKGVPKSVIYRLLRKGELRVNKKRTKPEYKLQAHDCIRIPPLHLPKIEKAPLPSTQLAKVSQLKQSIVYEDEHLLALNKPSGMAVHGGSGLSFGAIEALRALFPEARFLELVHRIDRDTSGLLLIAKKRSALRHLQAQFREKTIKKQYVALVKGHWPASLRKVDAPLLKNATNSIVHVSEAGKRSITHFTLLEQFAEASLIKASPITGRTHQIRVHALHAGHPLAQDSRYGDSTFDEKMQRCGLNRLFLHAQQLSFVHPAREETMTINAPLDDALQTVLHKLRQMH